MLTKKITYTDYNGEERTETFYFNISKAELTKLQFMHPGGYSEYLERIIASKDIAQLMQAFDDLVDLSYGEKSEDGKRFIKSAELTKAFKETEAYSEMFTELLSNAEAAQQFATGILPPIDMTEDEKAKLNARTKELIDSKKE